jgi:hypothetical protein
VVRIDRQVLLVELTSNRVIVLILCADICLSLSILECHAYVMSEIARCDEIIMRT